MGIGWTETCKAPDIIFKMASSVFWTRQGACVLFIYLRVFAKLFVFKLFSFTIKLLFTIYV